MFEKLYKEYAFIFFLRKMWLNVVTLGLGCNLLSDNKIHCQNILSCFGIERFQSKITQYLEPNFST
jgi:hypothetical protein